MNGLLYSNAYLRGHLFRESDVMIQPGVRCDVEPKDVGMEKVALPECPRQDELRRVGCSTGAVDGNGTLPQVGISVGDFGPG
jgi:hypothetical protein